MLDALRDSNNGVSFNVVAPSLPNFGWSQGVVKRGFGLAQYAEVCDQLMSTLGYKKYVTQGGDWGMMITRTIGLLYPQRCLASHINMVRASPPTFAKHPILALKHAFTPYSEANRKGLERSEWFLNEGSGYRTLQSTKPQTIGYAWKDSPVSKVKAEARGLERRRLSLALAPTPAPRRHLLLTGVGGSARLDL